MKPILGRAGLKQLERFSRARMALVLDYDGTICPIVPRAADAVIPAQTRRLLKQVTRLYPSAILSGRKLSDVRARVRGCGFSEVVGNHGLEWRGSRNAQRFEKLMLRCRFEIDRAIARGEIHGKGLEIEFKKVTLSVHYRMSPHRGRAYREILGVLRRLRGTHIIEGKQVFNLLPSARLNKGTAVLKLRRKFHCDRVIYVGDDWTDENVFRLRPKAFLLDVRVGRSRQSRARYYLPGIAATDRLLAELIRLRTRGNDA